jgi:hypothetical protein
LFGLTERNFQYSATLTWVTNPDGSSGIQGSNFQYYGDSGFLLGLDMSTTRLSASTFAVGVRQGSPGPVPEPGTWALMLLGFGAVGFTMRRNRKTGSLLPSAA